MAYTSVLENPKSERASLSSSATAITKAVNPGAHLVRQILTLARKTEVSPRPVNPNETIQELVKMINETFPKTIELVQQLDRLSYNIMIDSTQLVQCMLNLAVNARDAMAEKGTLTFGTSVIAGSELRGNFSNVTADQYICIRVADTGEGMNDQTLKRIFEPYFTTKPQGKGTGMGLAMVYGIVRSHNGFVHVESNVGQGTTFYLYFPAMKSVIHVSDDPNNEAFEIQTGTETIFVVEDEELLLDVVKSFLLKTGFKVMVAHDGQEALELYRKHGHDVELVLTDLGLPKMNGVDLIKELHAINPGIKVVMASGYISPGVRSELSRIGVEEFVNKPYRLAEVIKIIRKALDAEPSTGRQL